MKHEFRSILIEQIDVPENRLRVIKPARVDVLASDIKANGLLQPIGVVEEESGRFTLIFGATRLAACKTLGLHSIDARVQPHNWIKPQQRRIDEIMENLNREDLTMLERAESLAALKKLHEELYPDAKHGGDRKSQARRKNQKEIFSFRSEAAERTGLSIRAINIAVSMVTKLSLTVKVRLQGTWLEDHQAGLRMLSEQEPEMQHKVCDLLFATPPEAASVADAIVLAEGRRLPTAAEKLFTSAMNNLARLTERDRRALFDAHEEQIRAYAQEKGWL